MIFGTATPVKTSTAAPPAASGPTTSTRAGAEHFTTPTATSPTAPPAASAPTLSPSKPNWVAIGIAGALVAGGAFLAFRKKH